VSIATALAELDPALTAEAIDAAFSLFAPCVLSPHPDEVDVAYGRDPRQRFDLYRPVEPTDTAFVFVPGGGFTGGDKALPGLPFHGNVGRAAAGWGAVAAVMNYRLAPDHSFPAGAEDVANCAALLLEITGATRLLLAGHSAGAGHVADCIADPDLRPAALCGAALISGVYEPGAEPVSPGRSAYYGQDAAPSLDGVAALDLPVFVAEAERDPPVFRAQAAKLAAARRRSAFTVPGHTHISEVAAIGSDHDPLSRAMFAALQLEEIR
jgi:acetyl esterase/lipase